MLWVILGKGNLIKCKIDGTELNRKNYRKVVTVLVGKGKLIMCKIDGTELN